MVSLTERTLCINEANLSGNQNGGGTLGQGGAFNMSHQNATKPSSPSGVSHGVTLGQVCVGGYERAHVCCVFYFRCLVFTIYDVISLSFCAIIVMVDVLNGVL